MVSWSSASAAMTVASSAARIRPEPAISRTVGERSTRTPIGMPSTRKASVPMALSKPICAALAPRTSTASTSVAKSTPWRPAASKALEKSNGRPPLGKENREVEEGRVEDMRFLQE